MLSISDNWSNSSVFTCEKELPGYRVVRFDRDNGTGQRGGGGLLLYTEKDLSVNHIMNWNICTPDIECMWTKFSLKATRPTYFCSIYRPHLVVSKTAWKSWKTNYWIFLKTDLASDGVILCDLNIDLLNKNSYHCRLFDKFLKGSLLSQLVNSPTRIMINSSTLIDYIITNRPDLYVIHGVMDVGISDHSPVFTTRKKAKTHRLFSYVNCRNDRNIVPIAFQHEVYNIDWSCIMSCNNMDKAVDSFHSKLNSVIDHHAPYRQLKLQEQSIISN